MNIAVIGCGSIGRRYVQWLSELGASVSVFDNKPESMEAFTASKTVKTFTSLDAILRSAPDKVLISTPPNEHVDVAVSAMQAGADVLIEKPIAANLEDAERMIAVSNSLGRSAWVVCNMRFHPGLATLRSHLGKIGKVLFARAHFGHRLSQMRPAGLNIYASKEGEGGGVILDCIHEIDYLQWFFGEVIKTESWLGRIGPENIESEDYAEILLQYRSGIRASLHLDFLMRNKRRGCEIIGTEGNLVWSSVGRSPEHCVVTFADNKENAILLDEEDVDPSLSYRTMLKSFLANGNELQTAIEGHKALTVALQARRE